MRTKRGQEERKANWVTVESGISIRGNDLPARASQFTGEGAAATKIEDPRRRTRRRSQFCEVLGNEARPTNMEYVGGTLATTVAERDDNERVCLRFERVRQLEKTGAICF